MDRKSEPREELWKDIEQKNLDDILDKAAVLHGHYCPGLGLGVKVAAKAVKEMKSRSQGMEDVLAIVETNNCLSDGVQFVTGCTFGNNSLIFRDLGKTAFTLTKRDGEGIRLVAKPDAGKNWEDKFPDYQELFEKIVTQREGSGEDKEKFSRLAKEVSHYVVNIPVEDLFDIEWIATDIPEYAPIYESYRCDNCGEKVMATRTVERKDKILCLDCSDEVRYELTGFGIREKGENR